MEASNWMASDKKGKLPKGPQLLEFVLEGAKVLEEASYEVVNSTADSGSTNQAMWKAAGLKCTKDTKEFITWCKNPVDGKKKFYWMADIPHTIKALRKALSQYDIILPEYVVKEENLPTNIVSFRWLQELLKLRLSNPIEASDSENDSDYDDEVVFLAASHLPMFMIYPQGFDKMKVGYARAVFCDKTADSLELGVKKGMIDPAATSTVWFIRQVSQWFSIMTSRCRKKSHYTT